MQIFQISGDADKFGYLRTPDLPKCESGESPYVMQFIDCSSNEASLKDSWRSVPLRTDAKSRRKVDIWNAGPVPLIVADTFIQTTPLRSYIERSCELLPVTVDDAPAHVLNLWRTDRCLDVDGSIYHQKLEWKDGKSYPVRDMLKFLRFDLALMPTDRLFKVGGGLRSQIFTVHFPDEERDDDFVAIYRREGYKGLEFVLRWDTDNPDAEIKAIF